ncbi:MAG: hypothetical protein IKP00_07310 [Victivallales bacterium]|nr:hypothetical protein [Victivallales bacterium]
MDISINRNLNANKTGFETGVSAVKSQEIAAEKPLLSITSKDVDEESSIGSDIPEAALSREDALGKLVSSAFNFPPPPMPNFN